jgi:hypothetical protein
MAATYLSAVSTEQARDQEHQGILLSGVMNLVNVSSGPNMDPRLYSCSPRDPISLHEMKYLPPQSPHHSPFHNGHPLVSHNPWVVGLTCHDPTAGTDFMKLHFGQKVFGQIYVL